MKNLGIHHVSSLVSDIHQSYDFYHNTLGLKLLIKTVNQDEKTMYQLFFSDTTGRGGTEFTLFQINTFKKILSEQTPLNELFLLCQMLTL